MNDHDEVSELPELTDDAIRLLYHVCELAAQTSYPPFKALFTGYDRALEGQERDHEQDAVVFRYLMRLGDSARKPFQRRGDINLVERLRSLLSAQGITLQDDDDDLTRSTAVSLVRNRTAGGNSKRRVSFDNARVEERWLNEHTSPLIEPSPQSQDHSALFVERNRRALNSGRRAQSANSQRDRLIKSNLKTSQNDGIQQHHTSSDLAAAVNPTLLLEPSHTQLEQNAEAFLSTSDLRSLRRILHIWHESSLVLQKSRDHAGVVASSYDRKTLLRQAWDQWIASLQESRGERRRQDELDRQGKRASRERDTMLAGKALRHWATEARQEAGNVKWAQRHMLMVRYFWRWKSIAHDNQTKARSILCRKYLAKCRDTLARRLLYQEQAEAVYEESLLRRCKTTWFWKLCESRVNTWHDKWIVRRAFTHLTVNLDLRLRQTAQANNPHQLRVARHCLSSLTFKYQELQSNLVILNQGWKKRTCSNTLSAIRIQTRLAPIGREVANRLDVGRQRRAFDIWRNRALLSKQATALNNQRLLLKVWTDWNDALRCEALAQKQNGRLLQESLYKWVLQERLCLFRRTLDSRLLAQSFQQWMSKSSEVVDRFQLGERVFKEGQHKRRLVLSMFRLHVAKRKEEDAERAAVEFANSRELPKAFRAWRNQSEQLQQMVKWATDARFYFICSSTLKLLKQKASEYSQRRRRDAYAHVRARVKTRIVNSCFTQWSTKLQRLRAMQSEASRTSQTRAETAAASAFHSWWTRTVEITDGDSRAMTVDQRKLVNSVFWALIRRQGDLQGMHDLAHGFRHETDLISMAAALKKVQWSQFTAARRNESAEALWARNRDVHMRTMLRHWSDRAKARRTVQSQQNPEEMESPSLRPAGRIALQGLLSPTVNVQSAPAEPRTSGYMRTPSRVQRRAGRFRSLPTPAPVTPMGLDAAYFVTTPGPTATGPVWDNTLSNPDDSYDGDAAMEGLTPQITPFSRKLRAGGVASARFPTSALKSSVFGQDGGTGKSVRFARLSRFRGGGSMSGDVAAEE